MRREFISYPKSGRSWLRYALGLLGIGEEIRFHHDGFEFNDRAKPPLDFDPRARIARAEAGIRIVYLGRDPRDVMVSLYFQVTGRFRDIFGYEEDIAAFIRDDYFGAHNLRRFRSMWREISQHCEILHVTYEACHEDFETVLRSLVGFYGLQVPDDAIATAAENSNDEKMRAVERSGNSPYPWLRPRNNAYKVREARIGGFARALEQRDIDYLDEVFFGDGWGGP